MLKELFGEDSLTYDELNTKLTENGIKLADLSQGEYVSKSKFEAVQSKLTERENDLTTLQTQMQSNADNNANEWQKKLDDLQAKYEKEKAHDEAKFKQQDYEFRVKEFANAQQFTSNGAKREFIREMTGKKLPVENDRIMGADDFLANYKESNADSFVNEDNKPSFGASTQPPTDTVDVSKMTYSEFLEYQKTHPSAIY